MIEKQMKRTIALLFGGCSAEYEISLKSAAVVAEHLDAEKYQVYYIGITKDGAWYWYAGGWEDIANDRWQQHPSCVPAILSPDRKTKGLLVLAEDGWETIQIDVAFPMLHGRNGEDGTVQGLLELAGIPMVGCGVLASALGMDKAMAHLVAAANSVRVPATIVIERHNNEEDWQRKVWSLGFPLYVKPARAGSSFGITKVKQQKGLAAAVAEAFCYDTKIVVEENIEGFEVGCAVLGNQELLVGEVDEVQLNSDFFDYKEKYGLSSAQIVLPARIDHNTKEKIKQTAIKVYRALGCQGFARVDLFLTPNGDVVFNEINTIPGFTAVSRYPKMLQAIGLNYEQMLERLLETAVRP